MAKATSLMGMRARGQSMRNEASLGSAARHPSNKEATGAGANPKPSPSTEPVQPIKIKLPKNLESQTHQDGEQATYLMKGHHVKAPDGSTHFHAHTMDGEPVSGGDIMADSDGTNDNGQGIEGEEPNSPFGIHEALKGLTL